MNRIVTKVLQAAFAAAAFAVLAAPAALGSGEPKNVAPFTDRDHAIATTHTRLGEPKNEWPFTRHIGSNTLSRS